MGELSPIRFPELDFSDALLGLTPQQFRFADLVYAGTQASDAYRQAYKGNPDAASIGHQANAVLSHPKVQGRIRYLRELSEQQTILAPVITREFVLNGIRSLALKADKDSVRLRAYELLGRTVGIDLFRDAIQPQSAPQTPGDIDKALRQRLEALRDAMGGAMVDVTPRHREPPQLAPAGAPPRDRRRKPRG